jgi:carbohydrate-binding DOMON domain-containing protein
VITEALILGVSAVAVAALVVAARVVDLVYKREKERERRSETLTSLSSAAAMLNSTGPTWEARTRLLREQRAYWIVRAGNLDLLPSERAEASGQVARIDEEMRKA